MKRKTAKQRTQEFLTISPVKKILPEGIILTADQSKAKDTLSI